MDVLLQAFVEIVHANAGVSDRQNDQEKRDNSEECQRPPGGQVLLVCLRLVHADQLEQEVCHGCKVQKLRYQLEDNSDPCAARTTYNDNDHSDRALSFHEDRSANKNKNCNGNGSRRESEFNIRLVRDNDKELNRKTEEKEEIELQQSDIDLEILLDSGPNFDGHAEVPDM